MKIFIPIMLSVLLNCKSFSQTKLHSDPDSVNFVTSDINIFWKMYHQLKNAKSKADSSNLIQTEYLDSGSIVLKDRMHEKFGITANSYFWGLRNFPKYLASIEVSTKKIVCYKPSVISDFIKLKAIYPEAIFPDFYFVMGDFNSGGTPLLHGMFIGAEITGGNQGSPLTEFDNFPSLKNGLCTVNDIGIYCSHEIIHWQQKGKPASLLGATICEGAADFIGEKLSGGLSTAYQHSYGDKHQKLLWRLFKKDMKNDDYSQWLYNGSNRNLTVPADMGYYIGYKICEAYYNKITDKKMAIKDIIEVKNYQQFLKDSGYGKGLK